MQHFRTICSLAVGLVLTSTAVAAPWCDWYGRRAPQLQPEFFTLGAMYQAGTYAFPFQNKDAIPPYGEYQRGFSTSYGISVSRRMHRSGARLHTGLFQTEHSYVHVLSDVFDPTIGLGEFQTHYSAKYLTLPLSVSFSSSFNSAVKPFGKLGLVINQLQSVNTKSAAFGSAIGIENPLETASKADFRPTNILFELGGGAEIYLSEDQALSIVPQVGWRFAFEGDKMNDYFNKSGQSSISFGLEVRYHFYAAQTLRERRLQRRADMEAKRKALEDKINSNLQNPPNSQTP